MKSKAVDVTLFWTEPPPEPSLRLQEWQARFAAGWQPNGRIRTMGYHEASKFYGVYIWEYIKKIWPLYDDYDGP